MWLLEFENDESVIETSLNIVELLITCNETFTRFLSRNKKKWT